MKQIKRPTKKQPLAQKCDKFDDRLADLQKELEKIREEWDEMDMDALDEEKHGFWNSGVVEDFFLNIDNAISALNGDY